jgi:S1-C subfamily serine protease
MVKFMRPLGAGMVALALFASVACSSTKVTPTQSVSSQSTTSSVPAIQPSQANAGMSIPDLVKFAGPSVVRIETSGGVGTGFIVSADGYIITNNHVVATTPAVPTRGTPSSTVNGIQVTLNDGTVTQATVVGTDARSDLAVIKITQTGLPFLKMGTLDNVVVGQNVVAIGFALDLPGGEGSSFSVTQGIISAKNRSISESSAILGAIQTDAAINHGNSGGPLLDMAGNVVGVNTSLAPDSSTGGTAAGIGLAVGADTITAVFNEIKANGQVNRGLLGITNFEELRPAKAKALGLSNDQQGVLLNDNSVASGGPAAAAGLQANDVITKLGNTVVKNESDLAVALILNHAGDKVSVNVMRSGKQITVQVTLGTPAA